MERRRELFRFGGIRQSIQRGNERASKLFARAARAWHPETGLPRPLGRFSRNKRALGPEPGRLQRGGMTGSLQGDRRDV